MLVWPGKAGSWWWSLAGEGDVARREHSDAVAGQRGFYAGGDDRGAVVLVVAGVRAGDKSEVSRSLPASAAQCLRV